MSMTVWRQRVASVKIAQRWMTRACLVAGTVFLAAACQASGAPGAPATSTTGAAASSATPEPSRPAAATLDAASATPIADVDPRADGLDVAFGEYAITLEASVIRPGRVTLVVHNLGHLTHGLEMKLERSGSNSGSNSGSGSGRDREKIETRTFRSGETLRVEADLAPGVYEIECYVADHASRGMRTTLEVRADAPLAQPSTDAATPGTVRIVQFAFVDARIDVPVGTRINWTNLDPTPHTVTADGGAFDSRQLDPGSTFSVALDVPGTFTYHCEIHPTMVGTIAVN